MEFENIDIDRNVMSKLWKTKSLWIERTKNIFIHFLNCECADVAVAVCVCLFECLGVWGFAISTHDINLSFACANTCLAPISTPRIVQVHILHCSLLVKCMKNWLSLSSTLFLVSGIGRSVYIWVLNMSIYVCDGLISLFFQLAQQHTPLYERRSLDR